MSLYSEKLGAPVPKSEVSEGKEKIVADLGVGIVTYNRSETMLWTLASVISEDVRSIVIAHTGNLVPIPGHLRHAIELSDIDIQQVQVDRNSLPWGRHIAERELMERGCDTFLIADDDLVFYSGYLHDAMLAMKQMANPNVIVGGPVRNGWVEGDTMSEDDYLAWFHSKDVTPHGHVPSKTALYRLKFCGLWEEVCSSIPSDGVAFSEDRVWAYLAYEQGAYFRQHSYAGLHVPPTAPVPYPMDEDPFVKFRKERE